jgi:hypothetical protein
MSAAVLPCCTASHPLTFVDGTRPVSWVDRTWQNQNHVSAVQGPVVAVRPVRKRVLAVS